MISGKERDYVRPIAAGFAIVSVIFILLTMTTNLASHILPMNDDYLQVLIPQAPDGREPLALETLDQTIDEKTLNVNGTVENRTDHPISGLTAVIDAQDTTGRFGQTLEAPIDPAQIAPHASGTFHTSVTLQEKPAGYSLKFRLTDGPFVPHRDERAANYDLTGK